METIMSEPVLDNDLLNDLFNLEPEDLDQDVLEQIQLDEIHDTIIGIEPTSLYGE